MSDINEICIYFIGQDNKLFEMLFEDFKEIVHKGDIKILEGKHLKLINDENISIKKKAKKPKIISYQTKGLKYTQITKENIFDIFNCIKSNKNKKNIIIRFGNALIKEFSILNNKLEIDKPFILFCFSKQDDYTDNIFNNYKFPEYISYLILSEEKETSKFYCKITSFILEKSSYYNEEGNKYAKYYLYNYLYKEPKGFLYLNILLTGESRAGKSSFINRMFNKLISFESSKFESSTLKINSYELYPPEEEDQSQKILKKGYGGIRIYDTPGLVKKKDLNSFELIKSKLSNIFNKIHIIYFFIKAQSNLEQCIDILSYIQNLNINRNKKKLKKIPIIFIKNGEELKKTESNPILFQELKKELQKYKLLDLYDNSINQNNNKKEYSIDNVFDDIEDNNNNYDNYIEGNIIQIHIPTGKNINRVFSITKEYIIRNNNKLNNDLSEKKNDIKKLINYFIIEKIKKKSLSIEQSKDYNYLYKKCYNIVNVYKNECSLLYNLDILNEKSKTLYKIGDIFGLIFLFSIVLFPLAYPFLFLGENNTINYIALLFGFGEKDIYDYELNEYIYEKKKVEDKSQYEKEFQRIKEMFRNIFYYIGPAQCLIKSKEIFIQMINLLNELGNRSEEKWNEFKVEKI